MFWSWSTANALQCSKIQLGKEQLEKPRETPGLHCHIPAGDSYCIKYSSDQAVIAKLPAWGRALWVEGKHYSPGRKAAAHSQVNRHCWAATCGIAGLGVMLNTMRSCFLAIHGHFYPYFTSFFLCSPTCLALPHSKPLLLGVCQREQSVSITVAALHLCW